MNDSHGRLVVVRHAKSDYPWGVEDHDRPLNDRGRRDAPEVGRWLDAHVTWQPAEHPRVLVSTARRAQLTWGLAQEQLGPAWSTVTVSDEPRIYEAPVSTLLEVAREAATASSLVVIVGHNPGLAGLVHAIAVDDDLRRAATAKFPTSAIAVLDAPGGLAAALDAPGSLRVSAFAVPRG
jgi:phosphohistidine phosphatase